MACLRRATIEAEAGMAIARPGAGLRLNPGQRWPRTGARPRRERCRPWPSGPWGLRRCRWRSRGYFAVAAPMVAPPIPGRTVTGGCPPTKITCGPGREAVLTPLHAPARAAQNTHPWGNLLSRGCGGLARWPRCSRRARRCDFLLAFLAAARMRRRAAAGQAGAPAAAAPARARARTNEL